MSTYQSATVTAAATPPLAFAFTAWSQTGPTYNGQAASTTRTYSITESQFAMSVFDLSRPVASGAAPDAWWLLSSDATKPPAVLDSGGDTKTYGLTLGTDAAATALALRVAVQPAPTGGTWLRWLLFAAVAALLLGLAYYEWRRRST